MTTVRIVDQSQHMVQTLSFSNLQYIQGMLAANSPHNTYFFDCPDVTPITPVHTTTEYVPTLHALVPAGHFGILMPLHTKKITAGHVMHMAQQVKRGIQPETAWVELHTAYNAQPTVHYGLYVFTDKEFLNGYYTACATLQLPTSVLAIFDHAQQYRVRHT